MNVITQESLILKKLFQLFVIQGAPISIMKIVLDPNKSVSRAYRAVVKISNVCLLSKF